MEQQVRANTTDSIDSEALSNLHTYTDLREKSRKAKRKKTLIGAVTVVTAIVIGLGCWWFVSSMNQTALQEAPLQTASVTKGLYLDEVKATGKIEPLSSVRATPEVEGQVGEVFVSEGDTVIVGQPLYTIVNADLDKAVSQAQQGINEASNGVDVAQLALDDAIYARSAGIAAAEESAREAERAIAQAAADALEYTGGPATSFDVAQADSSIRSAELSLYSARNALAAAQSAYDDAVARAAKRTVASSIDGSVVAVNIEPGKQLGNGSSTASPVQIANLSQMLVSVEVNEVDILKLKNDQVATLSFTAIPDLELSGRVQRIATVNSGSSTEAQTGGVPAAGAGNSAVTYTVEILIDGTDARLKPGMTAKARVEIQRIEETLLVPVSAVSTQSSTEGTVTVVNAEDPTVSEERTVEILASDGLSMAVKGNLRDGDELALRSDSPLDTASVEPSPETAG